MKPLTLTMRAFGAYAQPTSIDFRQLGDDGLYLIAGKTGAGKTTIFDAICYALYGESSSKRRSAQTMHSDFARDDDTAVTLKFVHHGATYEVARRQKIGRDKQGNVKSVSSEATLTLPNAAPVVGQREVTRRVTELLGLTYDQFKQTVMIAQGEFRELLESDIKARTAILQRLFDTEPYSRMAVVLKSRQDEAEKALSLTRMGLEAQLRSVQVRPEDPLAAEVAEWQGKLAATTAPDIGPMLEVLGKLVAADADESQRLATERDAQQSKLTEVSAELARAEDIKRQWATLRSLQARKAELIDERRDWYAAEKRSIERQRVAANEVRPSYTRYHELQGDATNYRRQREQAERVLAQIDLDQIAAEERHCQALIQTGRAATESLNAVNEELRDAGSTQQRRRHVRNDLRELKEITIPHLDTNIAAHDKLRETVAKARQKYEQAYEFWEGQQATVLALGLQDGEPCPVCGSTTHPSPASADALCELTTEALSQLREAYESLVGQRSALEGQCRESADAFRDRVAKIFGYMAQADKIAVPSYRGATHEECADVKELFSLVKTAESLMGDAVAEIDTRCNKLRRRQQLLLKQQADADQAAKDKDALAKRRTAYKEQEARVSTMRQGEKEREARVQKAQLDFAAKLDAFGFDDEAEFHACLVGESQLTKRETELRNYEQTCRKCLSDLESAQRNLDGKPEVDATQMAAQQAELRRRVGELAQQASDCQLRRQHNEQVRDELQRLGLDGERQANRYTLLAELYTLVSGTRGGRVSGARISLEQYVQLAGFEQIVAAANLRLAELSGRRYELKLHQAQVGDRANSNTTLDLDVLDCFTGRWRSVKTLSGGESFAAALSLALGLSDVITSNAGGVSIDSLFIDEGFGSLDAETLRGAAKTLLGLTADDKQIGIISHREELAELISHQLFVNKTTTGSTIELRT